MPRVTLLFMLALVCSVVIVVHRFLLSSVSFLCASAGYSRRRCELAIAYTFGTRLINRQGLYITYDPFYYNQRFACYSRLGSMFDPTTCLQPVKPIQPCPLPANHVLLCYYCSLLSPCLVCMLRIVRFYPVTPWIGLSHYYIFVDDMIIIMLTILDEGWKVKAIQPR